MGRSNELFIQIRFEQYGNIGQNIPAGYDDMGELQHPRKSSYNMKIDAYLQLHKVELNELFVLEQRDKTIANFHEDEASQLRLNELRAKFPNYRKEWIF